MSASSITYVGHNGETHTLPIGRDHKVKREGACLDVCLERAVAIDCPLVVQILIRTDGEIVLWNTEWRPGADNTYWHFSAGTTADRKLTDQQREALERMWLGIINLPGNLGGTLGRPAAAWTFAQQTPYEVAAKHGAPRPILNG
jgi:hypothetical protein